MGCLLALRPALTYTEIPLVSAGDRGARRRDTWGFILSRAAAPSAPTGKRFRSRGWGKRFFLPTKSGVKKLEYSGKERDGVALARGWVCPVPRSSVAELQPCPGGPGGAGSPVQAGCGSGGAAQPPGASGGMGEAEDFGRCPSGRFRNGAKLLWHVLQIGQRVHSGKPEPAPALPPAEFSLPSALPGPTPRSACRAGRRLPRVGAAPADERPPRPGLRGTRPVDALSCGGHRDRPISLLLGRPGGAAAVPVRFRAPRAGSRATPDPPELTAVHGGGSGEVSRLERFQPWQ